MNKRRWLVPGMIASGVMLAACGSAAPSDTAAKTEAETSVIETVQTEAETAAAKDAAKQISQVQNVAGMPAPDYDYSQANQLPMTGYYEKTLNVKLADGTEVPRTVKFYISEDAGIRPYFTIVTVPEGQDTTEFLKKSGWFEIADRNRECLFVMEPDQSGKWGSLDAETAYVNAAMAFYKAPASDVIPEGKEKATNFFSSFGMNYFAGYGGTGAQALETYAANNIASTISQVYVNSTGVQADTLNKISEQVFDGDEASNNVALTIPESEWIHYNEIPVPTWFINCDNPDSNSYWKAASDCGSESEKDAVLGNVYRQSSDSDAWQTEYYGPISEVAELSDKNFDESDAANTEKIYNFLTNWTRYDNSNEFASQLSPRIREEKLTADGLLDRKETEVEGEAREYFVYTPANNKEKYPNGSPLLFVWPGNTQSPLLFMDATSWRTLADTEGFICVYPAEQYNASSSVTVSHKNSDAFYQQMRKELEESGRNIDWTRVYSTGQSAGSSATNSLASIHPEYFAACASTSGPATAMDEEAAKTSGVALASELANKPVPVYLLNAYGDMPTRAGTLFDDENNQLDAWADYFLTANSCGNVSSFVSDEISGKHDRFETWTWENPSGIPMTKQTTTSYRNHNCIDQEMPLMWDYLKHFSADWNESDGTVTRWYSESGFAEDDKVEIK